MRVSILAYWLAVCGLVGVSALAAAPPIEEPADLVILGETSVAEHSQVRLRAANVPAGAALIWTVTPREKVSRATTRRGLLEFAAPPGKYMVDLVATVGADTHTATLTVTVNPAIGGAIPPRPAPSPPRPQADPVAALGRLTVGRSGCTATIVSPRRPDGKWDVLSASHCTGEAGSKGTLRLKDGRSLALTVTVRATIPDLSWFTTDRADLADLPFADLYDRDPTPGTAVWQAGYGTNTPTVRKEGVVLRGENNKGQVSYRLSVSHGDSGGGIFRVDDNRLLGAVCCTEAIGRTAPMFAGSALQARILRPGARPADSDGRYRTVPLLLDAGHVWDGP